MSLTPPANLVALIESGSATICRCWIVTRRDGEVFGFTDHDARITVDGVECRPDSGALGSAVQRRLGLEIDRADIRGALGDSRITEPDLIAGRWRGAEVAVWIADWKGVATPWLIEEAIVGEVRRRGAAWVWELSDALAVASQAEGGVIQRRCAWRLGDADCGVNLAASAFSASVEVTAVESARRFTVSGITSFTAGWFTRGVLTWVTGDNAGASSDVRRHQGGALDLVDAPGAPIAAGDTGTLTAGCDHSAATCIAKFSNVERFGGDPFSITDAEFLAVPRDQDDLDGGSLLT